MQQLYEQNAAVILLYGVYEDKTNTGLLQRQYGHYTCLIGHSDSHLMANTYATDYAFALQRLPMQQLQAKDRYRPKGTESLIYLHYPSADYPRYHFHSFAPVAPNHALLQQTLGPTLFAAQQQACLLEGALAIWIHSDSKPEKQKK